MRARYRDLAHWHLLPPDLQRTASFRRSNCVVITILAFLTFGLLVVGFLEAHRNLALAETPPKGVAVQSAHHAPSAQSQHAIRNN